MSLYKQVGAISITQLEASNAITTLHQQDWASRITLPSRVHHLVQLKIIFRNFRMEVSQNSAHWKFCVIHIRTSDVTHRSFRCLQTGSSVLKVSTQKWIWVFSLGKRYEILVGAYDVLCTWLISPVPSKVHPCIVIFSYLPWNRHAFLRLKYKKS
jgi:hypothetical protein